MSSYNGFNNTEGLLTRQVTIADSATTSDAADLGEFTLSAIQVPANMEGTSITFQGSIDGSTFNTIHNTSNAAISVTNDTNARIFTLSPQDFAGFRWVKVVAGSAQTGAAAIDLIAVKAANNR